MLPYFTAIGIHLLKHIITDNLLCRRRIQNFQWKGTILFDRCDVLKSVGGGGGGGSSSSSSSSSSGSGR